MRHISVLILCPCPSGKGGVAKYYSIVSKYFTSDSIVINFNYMGKDTVDCILRSSFVQSVCDFLASIKAFRGKDVIVLNTSLDLRAVIRDGVYHFVAKRIFKKKTLVFYHAWFPEVEQWIEKYAKNLFRFFFNFDKALVLASQVKDTLMQWGYNSDHISLETTIYEHHDTEGRKDPFKIIFLARFVRDKGCLVAIRTVEILAKEFPQIRLYMAGDGELLPELKKYVETRNLHKKVEFTGWIEGETKYRLLHQCGIMLFPTSYGEGMPISILEGMGMGLAIVTRPVAGIPNILVDGENGFLVASTEPEDFAAKVRYLLENNVIWQTMSHKNIQKAAEQFEVRKVVHRIELLYLETAQ